MRINIFRAVSAKAVYRFMFRVHVRQFWKYGLVYKKEKRKKKKRKKRKEQKRKEYSGNMNWYTRKKKKKKEKKSEEKRREKARQGKALPFHRAQINLDK